MRTGTYPISSSDVGQSEPCRVELPFTIPLTLDVRGPGSGGDLPGKIRDSLVTDSFGEIGLGGTPVATALVLPMYD